MHKSSTASTKSSGVRCAPPALHSVGLLNLPYSTFAGANPQTGALARGATHSGRRVASCDKNLCIIRVNPPSRIRSVQSPSSEPCPNNLIDIPAPSGEIKEIRHQEGHILVCQGCCCGNTEKGFPAVPLQAWKSEWKDRGIRKRVHLTIAGCLGPCPLANVVLVIFRGACVWLQAINSPRQVQQIYDYVESMMSAGRYLPLPDKLEKFHFSRYDFDTQAASRPDPRREVG